MANYYGMARTNYFRVTDEEKYQKLYRGLTSEDGVEDFSEEKDGVMYHCFGSFSPIEYNSGGEEYPEYDGCIDDFVCQLQEILPESEAFIYQEIGYEKLRYLTGFAIVATHDKCDSVDIASDAIKIAKRLLNNDNFSTQLDY